MKVALDTNVIAYAEGIDDIDRQRIARETIDAIPEGNVIIPVQVLGEVFNVLKKKGGYSNSQARDVVLALHGAFDISATNPSDFLSSTDLVHAHGLSIRDAVILSGASTAGCRILLSEDMQDGFTWGGVTVVNPFAASPNPLLTAALRD